jgi:hypothetical protein
MNGCAFAVGCGERHTLVLVDENGGDFVQPQVLGGDVTSAACDESGIIPPRTGELYAFGSNRGGQLGVDGVARSLTPVNVTCGAWRRTCNPASISCGMHHSLAICIVRNTYPLKRRVYAWGYNDHGRLGVGHTDASFSPCEVALLSHRNVVSVKAGETHSVALTETGEVYTWGSNRFGQLGLGVDGGILANNLLPVRVDFSSAASTEPVTAVQIASGSRHCAVVTSSGELLLWGWGEEGQLANDAELNSNSPHAVDLGDGANTQVLNRKGRVVQVGLGVSHTVVLVENQNVVGISSEKSPVKAVQSPLRNEQQQEEDEEEEEQAEEKKAEELEDPEVAAARAQQMVIKEREALAAQQKVLAERRQKEAETLRRFEGRKDELKKKEEVIVAPPSRARTPSPISVVSTPPKVAFSSKDPSDDDSGSNNSVESVGVPVPNAVVQKIIAAEAATKRPKSPNSVSFENKVNYNQVYYHPDQPVEKCFVANSARRAMVRQMSVGTGESMQSARIGGRTGSGLGKFGSGGGYGSGNAGGGGGRTKKKAAAQSQQQKLQQQGLVDPSTGRPMSSSILRRSSFGV